MKWISLIVVGQALTLSLFAQETKTIDGQIFIRTEGAETIKLSLVDVFLYEEKVISDDLQNKRKEGASAYRYLLPYEKPLKEAYLRAQKEKDEIQKVGDQITSAQEQSLRQSKVTISQLQAYNDAGAVAPTALWTRSSRESQDALELGIASVKYLSKYTSIIEVYNKSKASFLEVNNLERFSYSPFYYLGELPNSLNRTKTDADGKFSFKAPAGHYVLIAQSSRNNGSQIEYYHWMVKGESDKDTQIVLSNDNLFAGCPIYDSDLAEMALKINKGEIPSFLALFNDYKRKKETIETAKKEREQQDQLEALRKEKEEKEIAAKQEFDRKLASGEIQIPLTKQLEIPSQYGKIVIPAGTRVTVISIKGNTMQIRQGSGSLTIPANYADTSTLK